MSLLGSLGGALSLYLGCALVMIFELLELGIDIGLNLWRHKRGHKDRQGKRRCYYPARNEQTNTAPKKDNITALSASPALGMPL